MQFTPFDGYTDTLWKQSQNVTSHFYRFSQMLDKMQQNDKREMILNRNNHKIISMLSNFCYDKSGYVANS